MRITKSNQEKNKKENYKKILKRVKKEVKGITLIALVVTIIVLLILAGISISMLTGQNGILNRAQEAKEKTEVAEEKEQQILNQYEQMINTNINERTLVTLINYTNHDNILAKDIKRKSNNYSRRI